jgi:peptidyl-Asp metalloendopeptidase
MVLPMRTVLAVGLLAGLLAGCSSDWSPGSAWQHAQLASDNPLQAAALVPSMPVGHSRIAGHADRGNFLAYGTERPIRKGAQIWHPVELSEAHALRAITQGGLVVPAPDGKPIRLQYARRFTHDDGNWTWVGRPAGAGQGVEAVMTFGDKAVFGTIPNGHGEPLQLTTVGGKVWLVETDQRLAQASGNTAANAGPDFVAAPPSPASVAADGLGMSLAAMPSASAMKAQAASASSAGAVVSPTTVDLVVGYTTAFATRLGGQSQALTRLNFMVDIANQAYANSEVNGQVRLVHAVQVDYPDATSNRTALFELSGLQCTTVPSSQTHLPDRDVNCTPVATPAALQPLLNAREQYRADLVSLVRILQVPENGSCGVAWLLGGGQQAIDANSAPFGLSVISDTSGSVFNDDGNTCRNETLAHEMGHNMGLAHDRATAAGTDDTDSDGNPLDPGEFGRYPYSFGYGTAEGAGNFYTIMAVRSGTQESLRVFSNPRISTCNGLPCGVADEEDEARTLEQTMPVVAAFRLPATTGTWYSGDFDGDGKSDVFWRNTSSGANTLWKSANRSTPQAVASVTSQSWKVVGIGDFDGDGKSDLLWRNTTTGANSIWKSGNRNTSQAVTGVTSQAWKVVGVGDFDGDGKSDILWRHDLNGSNTVWRSANAATGMAVAGVTNQQWQVAAVADYDGDGKSDILWRNNANGANVIWKSGNAATQQAVAGVTNVAWKVVPHEGQPLPPTGSP